MLAKKRAITTTSSYNFMAAMDKPVCFVLDCPWLRYKVKRRGKVNSLCCKGRTKSLVLLHKKLSEREGAKKDVLLAPSLPRWFKIQKVCPDFVYELGEGQCLCSFWSCNK